ncbi:MAG: FCD domain-containing protein [Succinivibrio sp.]|nr:FCD domain-containing protein [Succinivibrio sp.]
MTVIKRTSVTAQISDYLRSQIESGVWKVGEQIPSETVMTKELGVSRASLRTVISRFSALGILKAEQGKGCYLMTNDVRSTKDSFSSLSHRDYIDINKLLSFRLLIEPYAARMCASLKNKAHAELIAKLQKSLKHMQDSVDNPQNFIQADLEFHKIVGFACGNELIGLALTDVFAATVKVAQDTNLVFGFEHGLVHHQRIIAAIESHDAEAAWEAMTLHLQDALDKISDK